MININLLDWRAKKKFVANNRFYLVIALVIVVSGLLTASGSFMVMYILHEGKLALAQLEAETTAISADIKKIDEIEKQKKIVLTRRKIIQGLQKNRNFVVKVWNDLATIVPSGVVLQEITSKNNEILLVGTGISNTQIAMLMKNVQGLAWVQEAKLGELKSASGGADNRTSSEIDFRLQVILRTEPAVSSVEDPTLLESET